MDESGNALQIGAICILVGGLIGYYGLKLSKAAERRRGNEGVSRLSLAGTSVCACLVGFWLICLVAYKLRPESLLGAFVGTADGIATVMVASVVFVLAARVFLKRLGYSITK